MQGSSNVTGAGYDADRRVLRVAFGDAVYDYQDVDPETFDGLSMSLSPGRYVRTAVMPHHVAQRIEEPPEWDETPW